MTPTSEQPTYGEQFEQISERMDAAYGERRKHRSGSPEYAAADEQIEAVYADLRVLNAEVKAR